MKSKGHAKAGMTHAREKMALPLLLVYGRYRCVHVWICGPTLYLFKCMYSFYG